MVEPKGSTIEFIDWCKRVAAENEKEHKVEELEKRVEDLGNKLSELMLVMLRMCPGGVGCPYADRVGCGSGTIIPDTGDAIRPWDITYTG